jgi:hypothetical protein
MISVRVSSAFFSIFPLLPCTLDLNFVNNVCLNFGFFVWRFWHCQLHVLDLFMDCLTEANEKLIEFGVGGLCNCSPGLCWQSPTPLNSFHVNVCTTCIIMSYLWCSAKRWFNRRHWIYSRSQNATNVFSHPKFLLPRCHGFHMFAPSRITTNFS